MADCYANYQTNYRLDYEVGEEEIEKGDSEMNLARVLTIQVFM